MGVGNQKEEMKFVSTKENFYHGVIHSSKLNLLSLRIPKSACSYLRKIVFESHLDVVQYDELKDLDITSTYEIFESLHFHNGPDFFSNRLIADTPMIIIVRDPLERCCSGIAEIMNTRFALPGSEAEGGYHDRISKNYKLYMKYPSLVESIIEDKISISNSIYELYNNTEVVPTTLPLDHVFNDNHLVPQTHWLSEIMKVKDNIVFFEAGDFLTDNLIHFISNHIEQPFELDRTRANTSYSKPISMFTKSYLKAKICDKASNSPLRQSALEVYHKDIELYNSLKSKFYTLGQEA